VGKGVMGLHVDTTVRLGPFTHYITY